MTIRRLAALGDSLTQGFMSGAISRPELGYPSLIAAALGISGGLRTPQFPHDGLPFNVEAFLRRLAERTGPEVRGIEWLVDVAPGLARYIDAVEDHYEGRNGDMPAVVDGVFHNLAVWGFRVADALGVDPAVCETAIAEAEGRRADDALDGPSAAMYRTAQRVLDPNGRPDRRHETQVSALQRLIDDDGPLDALLLWFGANDCLGTVVEVEIRDMEEAVGEVPTDPIRRRRFNLTGAAQFESDYRDLAAALDDVVGGTPVFVGTVPHVTIPPITTGIGRQDGLGYFDAYARFFVDDDSFGRRFYKHLTRADAQRVDRRIDAFNRTILDLVAERPSWHVVDLGGALDALAVKRNFFASPDEALRAFYEHRGRPDHPLLALDPVPSILLLGTDPADGRRTRGGLTSLDAIHPTTIGYGIVAELFLEALHEAGIDPSGPRELDWPSVIAADTLLQGPPQIWDDALAAARHGSLLWDLLLRVLSFA